MVLFMKRNITKGAKFSKNVDGVKKFFFIICISSENALYFYHCLEKISLTVLKLKSEHKCLK